MFDEPNDPVAERHMNDLKTHKLQEIESNATDKQLDAGLRNKN
ncbi:19843_t:CDS:2 [Rhizophagus irregularis]|nr:19843_t:CDS:2 [Rhizophagus irregularis]